MERDHIVELIKDGRLQEAIKALDKAAENTHLHNDVITISAAYADYTKQNRSATEDFQTLNIQRSKITNSLLSILDDLSPEDLSKVNAVAEHKEVAQPNSIFNNKAVLYGIIGLLALIVLVFMFSNSSDTGSMTNNTGQNVPSSANNQITKGVSLVEYKLNNGTIGGSFMCDGAQHWIENNKFTFTEIKREDGIIFLHDASRGYFLELDLKENKIFMATAQDQEAKFLYSIAHFE